MKSLEDTPPPRNERIGWYQNSYIGKNRRDAFFWRSATGGMALLFLGLFMVIYVFTDSSLSVYLLDGFAISILFFGMTLYIFILEIPVKVGISGSGLHIHYNRKTKDGLQYVPWYRIKNVNHTKIGDAFCILLYSDDALGTIPNVSEEVVKVVQHACKLYWHKGR